jgi:hypothetical protein
MAGAASKLNKITMRIAEKGVFPRHLVCLLKMQSIIRIFRVMPSEWSIETPQKISDKVPVFPVPCGASHGITPFVISAKVGI